MDLWYLLTYVPATIVSRTGLVDRCEGDLDNALGSPYSRCHAPPVLRHCLTLRPPFLRAVCFHALHHYRQMGPVYLFAGNLSEDLLRGVRQLGPDYAFSFEPPQIDSREIALLRPRDPYLRALSELHSADPQAGSAARHSEATAHGAAAAAEKAAVRQKLHVAAISGILTPHILLAYNPSVWGGEYFLDNTPDGNHVRWSDGSKSSAGSGGRCTNSISRVRVIHSMAGSQAHVLIHPRRSHNTGGDGNAVSASSRSDPPARSRGWSGVSSDYNFERDDGRGLGSSFRVRPRPRSGCMHALRLSGTRECVTRDVRDALDCLGGVKVLVPLFAQYDHGVRRGGITSYDTDPRLNETVLALLAGTLRDRYWPCFSLLSLGCDQPVPSHSRADP